MRGSKSLFAGLTIGIALAVAGPAAAENVLRWASVGGALTVDPHAYDEGGTTNQLSQVYETLVGLDSNLDAGAAAGDQLAAGRPDDLGVRAAPERHPHNIDRIEFTPIADPEERLATLLRGDLDLLTDPPLSALDSVRSTPGLKLAQAPDLFTIYLGLDQGSAELRSSDIKGRNPFTDKRVRQAIYQAIDIEVIRKTVMEGLSIPAGMMVPPGVNGYAPDLDRRLPYDPADRESAALPRPATRTASA